MAGSRSAGISGNARLPDFDHCPRALVRWLGARGPRFARGARFVRRSAAHCVTHSSGRAARARRIRPSRRCKSHWLSDRSPLLLHYTLAHRQSAAAAKLAQWAQRALAHSPAGVHVALRDGAYCGFAAHDGNNRGLGWFGPTGTDWTLAGTLRFSGDVIGLFDCGTALVNRDELEAIGSEGSLFLDDPWHCNVPTIELRRDGGTERIEVPYEDSYRLELENLSDAIRAEGEPLLGLADAMGQARTIEALHASTLSGSQVSLS